MYCNMIWKIDVGTESFEVIRELNDITDEDKANKIVEVMRDVYQDVVLIKEKKVDKIKYLICRKIEDVKII
jgi:hypothetical protein